MNRTRRVKAVALIAGIAAVVTCVYFSRENWMPWLHVEAKAETGLPVDGPDTPEAPKSKVVVNEQAQKNLGLTAKTLKVQTYWKSIPVPGMVVDRPGVSDRGIVAPATGVVSRIFRVPGDTVKPGEVLFTLKLLSESLYSTQTDLFKAVQDIGIAQELQKRLNRVTAAISVSERIEVENQIARLQSSVRAYRQDLLNRGFGAAVVDEIAAGKFVNETSIVVPAPPADPTTGEPSAESARSLEVQELKVDLGQQVQAGQTLCLLANHRKLGIEGRAFRDETALLEKSVRERWPVEVDFQEDPAAGWDEVKRIFHIRYMANTIDPVNRTFAFLLPLDNESRTVDDDGRVQTLWRFRPGQKVRLQVRVEKLENVFVVPADAVAREGAEAFVFTQNVNTFERKPVRVLPQDRKQVVLANDGSLLPGSYVVQAGAAQLNRMAKSGGNGGLPKGFHMHADGSIHSNDHGGK